MSLRALPTLDEHDPAADARAEAFTNAADALLEASRTAGLAARDREFFIDQAGELRRMAGTNPLRSVDGGDA